MKARELMTRDPDVLTPDDTVARAAQLMRDGDYGLVPVVDDRSAKRLQGVITDRDIAVRCVAEGHDGTCRVEEHMTRDDLGTAREDDSEDQVMQTMQRRQVRRVPVVDERDCVVGIVAQADIALDARDEGEVEHTVERISEPAGRS